ncbi:hypothetical protein [Pedobacter nyackensis]|uniref:hypothetical protein n=1 Tax=Pedobacter nyackensis TaxID=475255 RepID=UPI00117F80E2|nr:hypothetical protein [Pedobacter nyackensis]
MYRPLSYPVGSFLWPSAQLDTRTYPRPCCNRTGFHPFCILINDKAYTNHRSCADLYYKLGLKDEALKSAEIAYQLIADEYPKAGKLTEELIKKIKAM